MISVQRILPYTKQLVLYALYDVLNSEESEYDKTENGIRGLVITIIDSLGVPEKVLDAKYDAEG